MPLYSSLVLSTADRKTFGINPPGYSYTNSEAQTLVEAMTSEPDDTRKGVIDTCIGSLKSGGVWDQMDILYVLAAHDSQAASLNWKAPGSFALSLIDAPTFTADRGYDFDGSNDGLDSAWDAGTNGSAIGQNSAHVGVYVIEDSSDTSFDFGADQLRCRCAVTAGARAEINHTSDVVASSGPASMPAHGMAIRRTASATTARFFTNGAADGTGTSTANALTTNDVKFGNPTSGFSDRQVGAGHIGGELSDAEALSCYNALNTYMVAVGADS